MPGSNKDWPWSMFSLPHATKDRNRISRYKLRKRRRRPIRRRRPWVTSLMAVNTSLCWMEEMIWYMHLRKKLNSYSILKCWEVTRSTSNRVLSGFTDWATNSGFTVWVTNSRFTDWATNSGFTAWSTNSRFTDWMTTSRFTDWVTTSRFTDWVTDSRSVWHQNNLSAGL